MSKGFSRILIAVIIIMLGLTIWDIYKNKSNGSTIEEKVTVEIEYLDENITDIINYLNNITINTYTVNKIESEEQETGQNQSSGGQSTSGSEGGQSSGGGSSENSGGGSGESSGNSSSNEGGNGEGSEKEVVQYQIEKNNILNSDREVTNWEQIKNDIEKLYTSLVTIELDLEEIGVENSEILAFSELLDNTIISIKEENKEKSIENLAKLYKYIPKFCQANDEKKYVYQTKAEIIEAYSMVDKEEWEQIEEKINLAEEKFSKAAEKSSKKIITNKVTLLLKDFKEGIKLKDKDVFYIKYKNLLDELNNLC